MFKKGSKLYSIFKTKCPRCHEGSFFRYGFTFNPKKITQIHDHCPTCDLKNMMEPSFFYGAMYVNYALTVAISVAAFVIGKIFINLSLLQTFAFILLVLFLLIPVTLRLSRIIWINMFVSYDEKYLKTSSKEKVI
ncbi:DUF983 domain-containing protein [Tenacibaculum maritimum]|uniref:DUF983 domain-containing protein n=1 Tax=Tenacibaculum maritimum TaxID=107401 RepID=UPI0010A4D147|nr:DUF983 domain-containing protein [Tenacibaculum maritimum]MCD9583889.1 DUF983 domain-containing protein [Tenacibaculum maritimum]MCD9610773.1 DUF983 domain-containing protein [Tenacibaculum maritimum]MCD9620553.1 DUF983 domain-containing protein [Tenacibaculum maritimum]MCD9626600.1 DUF983 domain-containing protein [Tenacibaculum maritimum]MCD9629314.1 DUF983 domain-containing protein [Tenacibaculum maritimum]